VRVGTDQRIRVGQRAAVRLLPEDHARQILEVDLVDDAGVRRDDTEVLKCFLTPAQERVAFLVPPEFERGIEIGGVALGVMVHLHGMVDDQLDRLERIHLARVTSEPDDAVPHRREIDHRRNAGEVLEQHAGGREGDLALRLGGHVPPGHRFDVLRIHEPPVFATDEILEQDLERVRQARDAAEPGPFEGRKAEHLERFAASRERGLRVEGIQRGHHGIIADNPGPGEPSNPAAGDRHAVCECLPSGGLDG
jgi:hypothetical protein